MSQKRANTSRSAAFEKSSSPFAVALVKIESNPKKMERSVMRFGKRKRVFLRSIFRREGPKLQPLALARLARKAKVVK
jgi:hypothetical protein